MGGNVLRIAIAPEVECGETVLSGGLGDISLPMLMHLLEIESLSGWLLVDEQFRVDFHRGRVTAASTRDKDGVDALKEVLVVGGTRFEFLRGKPRQEQALDRVSLTMFDSYRIRDDWAEIEGMVLQLVGDQRWRPTGREIDRLMAALDGKSVLRDLVAQTGVSLCAVVDDLLEARRLGLVVEAAPVPSDDTADAVKIGDELQEEPTQLAPMADAFAGDLFELRDHARAAIKCGDYELAEGALEAALRLSPSDRVVKQNLRRVRELRKL